MPFHLEVAEQGDRSLRFRRHFAAPRPLVWRALTDDRLIVQWLWTGEHRMTHCEQDFREGGALRWCWALSGGGSMGLTGRFVEILPGERLAHTELFDSDWTGGESEVTTLLRDEDGGTRMEMTVRYASSEARDRAAASPMAAGMEEGYARLDNLLPGWAAATVAAVSAA